MAEADAGSAEAFALRIEPEADEPESALVFVDPWIDGVRRPFLLDTGCARTTVAWEAWTEGLPALGTTSVAGVFAATSYDRVELGRVTLGPISVTNHHVDRRRPGSREPSLLGMDLLGGLCYRFRWDEARVDVLPGLPPDMAGEPLELDSGGIPTVEARLGEERFRAVWDSGAGLTLVDPGLVERSPGCFEPVASSSGRDAGGAERETPIHLLRGLSLGGRSFPAHRVAVVDLGGLNAQASTRLEAILGFSTLRHAEWLLDLVGLRWAFAP